MLTVQHNVPCARCRTRIPMVIEQYNILHCMRCEHAEVVCASCRDDRTCTRCGRKGMETDAERLEREFPGMMF